MTYIGVQNLMAVPAVPLIVFSRNGVEWVKWPGFAKMNLLKKQYRTQRNLSQRPPKLIISCCQAFHGHNSVIGANV